MNSLKGLLLGAAFMAGVVAAAAQNYSIDWYSVDGGGGTSTGGVYAVSGTIGQPDAGVMSGGNFTLQGGFWSIISAVQTPGAPLLRILLTTSNSVVVAWPVSTPNYVLQQNVDIGTTNWTSTPSPVVVGNENQLLVIPPAGNRFYRLKAQ